MRLPEAYTRFQIGGARGFALAAAAEWAREVLADGATLHEWAGRVAVGARSGGRGVVHVVDAPVSGPDGRARWAVRHYRRGGRVASRLDDRYARAGTPRPVAEAAASWEARARGVRTPAVVAGAVYPAGVFYRADLVTELVPGALELAEALFGGGAGPDGRVEGGGGSGRRPAGPEGPTEVDAPPRGGAEGGRGGGAGRRGGTAPAGGGPDGVWAAVGADSATLLAAAGRLVAELAAAGVAHADLNARNILVVRAGSELELHVLDLDRCRFVTATSAAGWSELMLGRLERSLAKLAQSHERPLPAGAIAALRAAWEEAS